MAPDASGGLPASSDTTPVSTTPTVDGAHGFALLRQNYKALLALGSAITGMSTIAGFVTGDLIVILQSAGAIAFDAWIVGLFAFMFLGQRVERNLTATVVVSVLIGGALFFYAGGPALLADSEGPTAVVLTLIGAVVLGVLVYQVNDAYQKYERRRVPATKTCPECANTVLAAARQCQYCSHRFDAA